VHAKWFGWDFKIILFNLKFVLVYRLEIKKKVLTVFFWIVFFPLVAGNLHHMVIKSLLVKSWTSIVGMSEINMFNFLVEHWKFIQFLMLF